MEDLYYIKADIGDYFEIDEMALINGNLKEFRKNIYYYEKLSFEELINNFVEVASELDKLRAEVRNKTEQATKEDGETIKNSKLEFLAIYEVLLNHDELLPVDEINDELVQNFDKVVGDAEAVIKLLDEIISHKKSNTQFTLANDALVKRDDGAFLNNHLDLKFKLRLIDKRQNANFDWIKNSIMEEVHEQLENLKEQFGRDAKITFGGGNDNQTTIVVDEEGDVEITETYQKEPERIPSKVYDDPMYR